MIAGDRGLLNDLIAAQVEDKLLLRLADRDDYRIVNINPRTLPDDVPLGGLRRESADELQLALLVENPYGQAQPAALRRSPRSPRSAGPRPPATTGPSVSTSSRPPSGSMVAGQPG